ncbi:MAG: transferrin-binding protein-like solute binding protein [Pseudomonadota bacterium]
MKSLIAPALTLTLAACGGSNSEVSQRIDQLHFGSTDPAQAANGLDYADADSNNAGLLGQEIQANAVLSKVNADTGAGQTSAEATIVEFIDGNNFTIRIGGETLTFVSSAATRPNGDSLIGTLRSSDFANQIEIRNTEWATKGAPQEFYFGDTAFGFETNPETVAQLGSTVTYAANFIANGVLSDNNGLKPGSFGTASGLLLLVADFDDGSVGGTVQLSIDEEVDATAVPVPGANEVTLQLTEAAIEGNGFVTDMTGITCAGAVACTSNSAIGGVFYGPNAEEVAGVSGLDVSFTDDSGNTTTFQGSGGFTGGSGEE